MGWCTAKKKPRRKQTRFHTNLAHVATGIIIISYFDIAFDYAAISSMFLFGDILYFLYWFLIRAQQRRPHATATRHQLVERLLGSVGRAGSRCGLPRAFAARSPTLSLSPCLALFSFSFLSVCACVRVLCASVSVCVYLALPGKRTTDNPRLCVCVPVWVCVFFVVAFDIVFVALCKECR